MIFTHIFEAIALENTYLSAFVQTDVNTLHKVTFVRYLDTVTFRKSTASILDKEGYLICYSSKYNILSGIHDFKCSKESIFVTEL